MKKHRKQPPARSRSTDAPKKNGRGITTEQLAARVSASLETYLQILQEHESEKGLMQILEELIKEADSGSKFAASCLLKLGIASAEWLSDRLIAQDALVLQMASESTVWPALYRSSAEGVLIPKDLGLEVARLNLKKLRNKPSRPKDVAAFLFQIVELTEKLVEVRAYAQKLEIESKELVALFSDIGESALSGLSKPMMGVVEKWNAEIPLLELNLQRVIAGLAEYLKKENPYKVFDRFSPHICNIPNLSQTPPAGRMPERWQWAKRVFLEMTAGHPETCVVFTGIAEARANSYKAEHKTKSDGVGSVRRNGIIEEIRKVFLTLERTATRD